MKLDEMNRITAEARKNEKESFNLKYLRLFLCKRKAKTKMKPVASD